MKSLQKFSKGHNSANTLYLVDCNLETIYAAPHHGLTINEVSA